MTGFDGGKLAEHADLEIRTQSNDMQIVENMHLAILHSMLKI
jgi:phosphoheptose isomerase